MLYSSFYRRLEVAFVILWFIRGWTQLNNAQCHPQQSTSSDARNHDTDVHWIQLSALLCPVDFAVKDHCLTDVYKYGDHEGQAEY